MVVYHHSIVFRQGSEAVAAGIFNWGTVGVAAFFCISGFVVPYSFGKGKRPASGFVISRVARLYPAYWCSIAAAILATLIVRREARPAVEIFANITMIQRLLGQPDILGVYWTLLIELVFYALCLLFFSVGFLRSKRFLFFAALACQLVAILIGGAIATPALSLSLMLVSCLFRNFVVDRDATALYLVVFGVGSSWLFTFFLVARRIDAHSSQLISSWLLGIALFAAATLLPAPVPRLMIELGTISYGIYLYHELTLGVLKRAVPEWLNTPLPTFVLASLTTVVFATISYRVVEHPAILLGKRFVAKLNT